jgi:hypothetical protein
VSLDGFPRRTLRADQLLHRIHRLGVHPWWFSRDGSGRFDPVGTDHGACYLAERPIGAWIEVFRKRMLLPEEEVAARALLSVRLGRTVRLADLTSRRALAFGVTAAVGAAEDYSAGHRFAVEALAAGFCGVRYWVRHDPAQQLYGFALFAPAGTPDPGDPLWPADGSGPIPELLTREARRVFGYRVLPTP